jgi:hypothetical protein
MIHQFREAPPDQYFGKLAALTEMMKSFVIEEGPRHGLKKAVEAAQRAVGIAETALNCQDPQQIFQDPKALEAWKSIFLPLLEHFDSALSLDIENLYIYVLEKKLGYDLETLVTDIEACLPEDHRGMLSEFARDNMQEAGACLAFHRFTACGYHMARAVEDVARRYNYAITGNESPYTDRNGETRHRSLAQITGELQDTVDNWKHNDDPRLLSLIVPTLRNFCRIYRTPLSHADPQLKELDANDAEIAFGHAILAISTMLEDGRAGGPHFQHAVVWQ